MLIGAAAIIWVRAGANVANFVAARAVGRRREFTIRTAIGCSRPRLERQILTESMALYVCGGIAGIVLAYWFSVALARFAAAYVAVPAVSLDWRALAFSAAATLFVAILFGAIPTVRSAST